MANKHLLAGAFSALVAVSVAVASPNEELVRLREVLQQRYPKTRITEVRHTELSGIYEVVMSRNVAYTDREGRIFLFGHMYDMEKQEDLTEARREALTRVDWSSLPKKAAVVVKQGSGERELAVFTDPDCPWCRKLEPELAKLKDTTIYLFLLSPNMHPQAKEKVAAVLCSKDAAAAWRQLMLENKQPVAGACSADTDAPNELAAKFGLQATPTMIRPDGKMLMGAKSADAIQAWMEGRDNKVARRN